MQNNNLKVFNFIKARKIWLAVYAVIIVATFIMIAIFGVNLSIDFSGGTVLNYSFDGTVDLTKVETIVEDVVGDKISVSENTNFATQEKSLAITMPAIEAKSETNVENQVVSKLTEAFKSNKLTLVTDDNSDDDTIYFSYTGEIKDIDKVKADIEKNVDVAGLTILHDDEQKLLSVEIPSALESSITAKLLKAFPDNNIKNIGSNTVSGTIANNFLLKCLVAVVLAGALVIIYVGIRFRKIGGVSAGMFALLALLLDCFAAFAASVFFRLEIDSNFMSVILTTLGYSLNDTIVIYDRIRENAKLYPEMDLKERINTSISQSLGRTLKTALATFLAIVAVVIVAEFFGLSTLRSFAIPMAVGILSGCISTLFLSSPLWYSWKKFSDGRKAK